MTVTHDKNAAGLVET